MLPVPPPALSLPGGIFDSIGDRTSGIEDGARAVAEAVSDGHAPSPRLDVDAAGAYMRSGELTEPSATVSSGCAMDTLIEGTPVDCCCTGGGGGDRLLLLRGVVGTGEAAAPLLLLLVFPALPHGAVTGEAGVITLRCGSAGVLNWILRSVSWRPSCIVKADGGDGESARIVVAVRSPLNGVGMRE